MLLKQMHLRRKLTCLVSCPLKVKVSNSKWFILNLNHYRNTHYQVLNKAKALYKEALRPQLELLEPFSRIQLTYTYYPVNKRLADLGNVLSIHQKFFEDALVELGKLPADTYKEIPKVIYSFGEIDPTNPRVEVYISECNT